MPTGPTNNFLLLRDLADLARANDDLSAYLTIRRNLSPDNTPEALLGIWVGESGVSNPPTGLQLPDATGLQHELRVFETIGVHGVWMLCSLKVAECVVSRIDLAAGLLRCFDNKDMNPATTRFIPVFATQPLDSAAAADMQLLAARFPGLLLEPIFQEADGRLTLPSALAQTEGARA